MSSFISRIYRFAYWTTFLLAGCGSGPKTDSSQATPAAEGGGPAAVTPGPFSIAVDRASGLPKCDSASDRQLVFARDVGQFFSCEGGVWTDVPVGKNGDKGEPGQAGAVVPTLANNEWVDPMSGKHWVIAGLSNSNNTDHTCTGEWHLPSINEARSAAVNGIFTAVSSYGWTRLVTAEFRAPFVDPVWTWWGETAPSDGSSGRWAGAEPGTYRVTIAVGRGQGIYDWWWWLGPNSTTQFIACVHSASGP